MSLIRKSFHLSVSFIFNISKRIITNKKFQKIVLIFVVGFTSRLGVNYFLDVNVFVDFLNVVSLVYYGFMSVFVVFIEEVFCHYDVLPDKALIHNLKNDNIDRFVFDKDNNVSKSSGDRD